MAWRNVRIQHKRRNQPALTLARFAHRRGNFLRDYDDCMYGVCDLRDGEKDGGRMLTWLWRVHNGVGERVGGEGWSLWPSRKVREWVRSRSEEEVAGCDFYANDEIIEELYSHSAPLVLTGDVCLFPIDPCDA